MEKLILVRDRQLKLITDGAKLTFISAPSGYGKTTLVHLWLEQTGLTPIFISLSEAHNDMLSVYKTMSAALETHLRADVTVPVSFGRRSSEGADVFSSHAHRIIELLSSPVFPYVLVLDDFHLIHNEYTKNLLISLIDKIPENSRVFILSRQEPCEQFEPLKLKGQMTFLGADDLKFSCADIVELAELAGRALTTQTAAEAFKLTVGWPVAVHAYLFGKTHVKENGIQLIYRFFEDDIWQSYDNPTRIALLLSSVVDVLTPSLFLALTDETQEDSFLEDICGNNAFFSHIGENNYRFHSLFRAFLEEKLSAAGFSRREQYRKAAKWYDAHDMPYMAVKSYMEAGCFDEMQSSLYLLFRRANGNCSVDEHFRNIQSLELSKFPVALIQKNIYLYETCIWGYYLGGQAEQLTQGMDAFKELLTAGNNKTTQSTATLFCAVDHRRKLSEIVDELFKNKESFEPASIAHTATLSQNLPFFHRSYRDHSDYADDTDIKLHRMRETLGKLVGREYETIENCIRAGIAYEKGLLKKSYTFALEAVSEVREALPPETAFCARMSLASVLYALGKKSAADKLVVEIHSDLIKRESLYLIPNLQAFIVKMKLYRGDAKAAWGWLQSGLSAHGKESLLLYKVYMYFTTAKAYIVSGTLDTGIPFIEKLLELCVAYDRTLDIIDAYILLSIALRLKKRDKDSDEALSKAVETAQQYGFIQPFVLECDSLAASLGRLYHRIMQPDYRNRLDSSFVKSLYLATLRAARQEGDAKTPEDISLSDRQIQLVKLLSEGYSYQGISEETGLKPSTIKTYLKIAYQKLGATNKREAVERAAVLGIIK